jgi:hypothetical protein
VSVARSAASEIGLTSPRSPSMSATARAASRARRQRLVTGHGVTRTAWTIGGGGASPSACARCSPAHSPAVVQPLPTGTTSVRGHGSAPARAWAASSNAADSAPSAPSGVAPPGGITYAPRVRRCHSIAAGRSATDGIVEDRRPRRDDRAGVGERGLARRLREQDRAGVEARGPRVDHRGDDVVGAVRAGGPDPRGAGGAGATEHRLERAHLVAAVGEGGLDPRA